MLESGYGPFITIPHRVGVLLVEFLPRAQEARLHEVHQTPEIKRPVLKGSTGHRDGATALKLSASSGHSRLGILYFLFLKYVRYVFADAESLALLALNPQLILDIHIGVPIGLGVVAVAAFLVLTQMKTFPHVALRLLKGGFGFALVFLLFFVPTNYSHFDFSPTLSGKIYQSHHLFVEVLEDDTGVCQAPSKTSPIIRTVNNRNILLLADVAVRGGITWNKVLADKRKYGWIPRIIPAKIGVPEKRLTIAHKFYFRYRDLYALIAGLIGFIWGVQSFRIRPT